jgi:hypothetical protein
LQRLRSKRKQKNPTARANQPWRIRRT